MRQCTTSRFCCSNSSTFAAKVYSKLFVSVKTMAARLKEKKERRGRRARGDDFSYLQHRQSLAEYLGRVYDVVGGVEPFGRVLAQVCKLAQGRVGLDEDKQRRGEKGGSVKWLRQDFTLCCARVCGCVRVSAQAEKQNPKKNKKQNRIQSQVFSKTKIKSTVRVGGAYKCAFAP